MTNRCLAIGVGVFILTATVGSLALTEDPKASSEANVVSKALAPKIQFSAPVFDFGKIAAGAVVQHDYEFTNIGTAPLILAGVYPSCDCTTADRWSVRVEEGQTGKVPVQFKSDGYVGPINKFVMVASNAPDQPMVMLTLKGTVEALIDVTPANAVFTRFADAPSSETKVIHIINNAEGSLILSAPESTDRAFAVELKTVRAEKEFELRITTTPTLGAAAPRGLITIKTNSSRMPVIAVTVVTLIQKRSAAE